MILSLCICHLTYFRICSSSRPIVLTQYPLCPKKPPQYRFLSSKCISKFWFCWNEENSYLSSGLGKFYVKGKPPGEGEIPRHLCAYPLEYTMLATSDRIPGPPQNCTLNPHCSNPPIPKYCLSIAARCISQNPKKFLKFAEKILPYPLPPH